MSRLICLLLSLESGVRVRQLDVAVTVTDSAALRRRLGVLFGWDSSWTSSGPAFLLVCLLGSVSLWHEPVGQGGVPGLQQCYKVGGQVLAFPDWPGPGLCHWFHYLRGVQEMPVCFCRETMWVYMQAAIWLFSLCQLPLAFRGAVDKLLCLCFPVFWSLGSLAGFVTSWNQPSALPGSTLLRLTETVSWQRCLSTFACPLTCLLLTANIMLTTVLHHLLCASLLSDPNSTYS